MKKKILVTGFGPFLENKINPTEILVREISSRVSKNVEMDPLEIDTLILPVTFETAFAELNSKCESFAKITGTPYAAILMLGLASGRSKISLERVGLNWVESREPDNLGFLPARGAIDPRLSPAIFTSFQLEPILEDIKALGVASEVSLSAGGYVCNYLYYSVLSHLNIPSLFVHFPDLKENSLDGNVDSKKTGAMELSAMTKALETLIESILLQSN